MTAAEILLADRPALAAALAGERPGDDDVARP
jgi:hypothetical protein